MQFAEHPNVSDINDLRRNTEKGDDQIHCTSLSVDELASAIDEFGARERLSPRIQVLEWGRLLRDARIFAGFTQEQVAVAAGVTRATLAGIESGSKLEGPRLATLIKLFSVLGLEIPVRTQANSAGHHSTLNIQDVGRETADVLNYAPCNKPRGSAALDKSVGVSTIAGDRGSDIPTGDHRKSDRPRSKPRSGAAGLSR